MKTAVIVLREEGKGIVEALLRGLPECDCFMRGRDGDLDALFRRAFSDYRGVVCVMACGIVARKIAPLIRSKRVDPAVVVVDDAARWAVSLLSGHEGGANRLAYAVAALTDAEPVVTTGSETVRRLIMGVGCRRGVEAKEVEAAIRETLSRAGAAADDVRHGVSIRRKAGERGLREGFERAGIPLLFIPEERINAFAGPYAASTALRAIGVRAVAEPCALLGGRRTRLVVRKQAFGRVTCALAREEGSPWEA